ncbi:MAG TPA: hypothetical protein V6C58_13695 [Allocoleopsis sp.]
MKNATLDQLIIELGSECKHIMTLINRLQLSNLSEEQTGEILAELLARTIRLHSHCDEELQGLILQELGNLSDE